MVLRSIPLQHETPFSVVGLSLSDLLNVRPWLVREIENVRGETHEGPKGINFREALIFVFTHNMSCWKKKKKHDPPMAFTHLPWLFLEAKKNGSMLTPMHAVE